MRSMSRLTGLSTEKAGYSIYPASRQKDGWSLAEIRTGSICALKMLTGSAARVSYLKGDACPEEKPWGMYEFALSDPDGTLVRVGWSAYALKDKTSADRIGFICV